MTLLPPDIRKEVERRMRAKQFSDYERLAQWVREQGYDISDDSLWRYGKSLKHKFAATEIALHQARMLADQAANEGQMMQALVQVVMQMLLSASTGAEELDHVRIRRLAHAVTQLARVSLLQQRRIAEASRQKKERGRKEKDAAISNEVG
jgi:hypothetical protein